PDTKEFDKVEAIASSTSATVTVNLWAGTNSVASLSDSSTLLKAHARYLGQLDYGVTGDQEKIVQLDNGANNLRFLDWFSADLGLNVALNTSLPMALTVTNGAGNSTLDLALLNLTSLRITTGSGVVNASLPASTERYTATVFGGSGLQTISIPA